MRNASHKTSEPIRTLWNVITKLQHKSSKEKSLYLLFHTVHCTNWQSHMSSAVKWHTDVPTGTKVSKTLISQSLFNMRRYHLFLLVFLTNNCPLRSPDMGNQSGWSPEGQRSETTHCPNYDISAVRQHLHKYILAELHFLKTLPVWTTQNMHRRKGTSER